MMKLFCAVIGEAGSAFVVDINEDASVSALKDAIQTEKRNTIHCDTKDVQLFLAKKGDAWLDGDGVTINKTGEAPVMVDDPENPHHFVKMDSTLRLNNDKHFGANFQPDEDQVHVLVKMPPRKKQRVDDDELAFWQETLDAISKFGQGLKPETDLAVGALLNTPPKSTGSEFLGVKVHGGLYVRQEYWDIYEILKEKLQREKRIDRVLVIGSPGIGKSVFGVFLLLLLLNHSPSSSNSTASTYPWHSSLVHGFM